MHLRSSDHNGSVSRLLQQVNHWVTGFCEGLELKSPDGLKLSLPVTFSKDRGGSVLFHFLDTSDARNLSNVSNSLFLRWDATRNTYVLHQHPSRDAVASGAGAVHAGPLQFLEQATFRFTRAVLERSRQRTIGKSQLGGAGIPAASFPPVETVKEDVRAALPYKGHRVKFVVPEQYPANNYLVMKAHSFRLKGVPPPVMAPGLHDALMRESQGVLTSSIRIQLDAKSKQPRDMSSQKWIVEVPQEDQLAERSLSWYVPQKGFS